MATKNTPEPTIESLQADNARLQQELAAVKHKYSALDEELAAAKTELQQTQELLAEQAQALANAEAAKTVGSAIVVTHEQQQYRVLGKQFNVKGTTIKAEELAKHPEALAHLVASQSDLLQPLAK